MMTPSTSMVTLIFSSDKSGAVDADMSSLMTPSYINNSNSVCISPCSKISNSIVCL